MLDLGLCVFGLGCRCLVGLAKLTCVDACGFADFVVSLGGFSVVFGVELRVWLVAGSGFFVSFHGCLTCFGLLVW